MASATAITGWVVMHLWPDYHTWNGTVLPWVTALVLVMGGAFLIRSVGSPDAGLPEPTVGTVARKRSSRANILLEAVLFALILVLAIFLRTYRLGEIPAGIWHDETDASLDALRILDGHTVSPFGTGWYQTPNGFIYYMAGVYRLLGASHLTLKLVSLIPAILTVAALYPLGRSLFGPATGLCAMFLLAVSRWHLSMSRWGWNELAPPLFQVLATYLLVRGLRGRRAFELGLGGVVAGLMIYTYPSSRISLLTILLFAVLWVLLDPDGIRRSFRRHWGGLLLFCAASAVSVAPLAVTFIRDPETFARRLKEVSVFNDVANEKSYRPLVGNLADHLRFFFRDGDRNGRHNLPGEPQLDPLLGVLFLLGLGRSVFSLRDRRSVLLLLWFGLALANGIFGSRFESPQAYRTIAVVPAVALLAADTLVRLARALRDRTARGAGGDSGRMVRAAGPALVLAGLAGVGGWETAIYFGPQTRFKDIDYFFNTLETHLADDVSAALRRGSAVYLEPQYYQASQLRFLLYDGATARTGRTSLDNPPCRMVRPAIDLPLPPAPSGADLFLSLENECAIGYLKTLYPDAAIRVVTARDLAPWYIHVRLQASDLAAIAGLTARFASVEGRIGRMVVSRPSQAEPPDDTIRADWAGGLSIPQSGSYELVPADGLGLEVDGAAWSGRRYLAAGLHDLHLWQVGRGRHAPATLGWIAPGASDGAEEIPAAAFFQVTAPRQGLRGYYYPNAEWKGAPLFTQVAPYFLLSWPEDEPIRGAFTARFLGRIRAPVAGLYRFRIRADDGARLIIDGRVLGEGLVPGQFNEIVVSVVLAAGDHPIEIDYLQMGGGSTLDFLWQHGDERECAVPPSALFPDPG